MTKHSRRRAAAAGREQYPRQIVTEGQRRDVRTIYMWIAGIAVASGLGVALAGPSPTGSSPIDVFLIVVAVGLSILVISTAPWTRKWPGTLRPVIVAAVVGVVVQVLARLGNIWHFGVSAAIAIVPVVVMVLISIQRHDGQRRVKLWATAGGLLAGTLLALLGFGVAAAAARPNFTKGADEAKLALRDLKSGDFDGARQGFELAAGLLGGAADNLDALWAQPARLVPVVAQHRSAAARLAESAQSVSTTISDVLGGIDFDQLRVVNGGIDIAAVTALQQPLAELNQALADLHGTVDAVDSPWLVEPVRTRLATFTDQIADQEAEGERAMLAVQLAPDMLGAKGKRVYFIAFTTPSEARGLGGFMGDWAEVTMDTGHISVTAFGRTADLVVNGDTDHWTHITNSPDFPVDAESIAEGYPAYSGHTVDGIFGMDVYTVAALMTMTGPIELTSVPQTVDADNVAKFLLSDQYALAQNRPDRIDMLEEVAGTTINRLLTTSLPAPPDLVTLLAPMVAQGRLVAWSTHAADEDLFARMGMSGELPTVEEGDGIGLTFENVGGNKIDYYLKSDATYSVDTDPLAETVQATLDLTLQNTAPSNVTDPVSVFGNVANLPTGTNGLKLSVYSVLPISTLTVDGTARAVDETSTDHGFTVSSLRVDTSAQSISQVHVEFLGRMSLNAGYHLATFTKAAANPTRLTVTIDGDAAPQSPYLVSGSHLVVAEPR